MSDHPTEKIVIMEPPAVDEGIAPVVRFINGFDGIHAIWSCQGDDPNLWMALASVEVVIDYHNSPMPFWFHLRFRGAVHLRLFTRWLIEQRGGAQCPISS